jgi:hypothetical protein
MNDSSSSRIALLVELHRPLEEHWKASGTVDLDPKGSDHIYKHHVTRLKEIYTNHKLDTSIGGSAPPQAMFTTPVTMLYGNNGLMTKNIESTHPIRESKWNNRIILNENLSHTDDPEKKENDRPMSANRDRPMSANRDRPVSANRDRPMSANRDRPMSANRDRFTNTTKDISSNNRIRNNFRKGKSKSNLEKELQDERNRRFRCVNDDVATEDLIMVGLYRFNPQQLEIFNQFTAMLSSFDEYDMVRFVLYFPFFSYKI